mmetsp:Transcript_20048/g.79960  ORF Transcript_20048/g.79960 Transcript_20048/m.79960 type:complete len:463 (-) Transcript_20048:730-2118(-)
MCERYYAREVRGLVRRTRRDVRQDVRRRSAELQRRRRHSAQANDRRVLLLRARQVRRGHQGAHRGASRLCAARGAPSRSAQDARRRRSAREALDIAHDFRLGRRAARGLRQQPRHVRLDRRALQLPHRHRLARGRADGAIFWRDRGAHAGRLLRQVLARRGPRHRQGHRAVPRDLLARDPAVGGAAVAETRLLPRLRARRGGREDVQDARQRPRRRGPHRQVRLRRVPVLLGQGGLAGGRRQVLRDGAHRGAQRRARRRLRQPRPPGDGPRRVQGGGPRARDHRRVVDAGEPVRPRRAARDVRRRGRRVRRGRVREGGHGRRARREQVAAGRRAVDAESRRRRRARRDAPDAARGVLRPRPLRRAPRPARRDAGGAPRRRRHRAGRRADLRRSRRDVPDEPPGRRRRDAGRAVVCADRPRRRRRRRVLWAAQEERRRRVGAQGREAAVLGGLRRQGQARERR